MNPTATDRAKVNVQTGSKFFREVDIDGPVECARLFPYNPFAFSGLK